MTRGIEVISSKADEPKLAALHAEIAELRHQLAEAQQTLHAVRRGNVDAIERHPERSLAVIPDITYLKQAHAGPYSGNAIINTLLQVAPLGVCFLDRDLRFGLVNERLAEMNGIPAEAHLGRHVSEVLPALVETVREVTDRILATDEAVLNHEFSGETPFAPGVTRFWCEHWYPVRDGAGEVMGFGGIVEDITHRKLVEEKLRGSEERIHQIFDSMFTFVGMIAPDGTLTEANDAPLAAAGLSRSDVIGKLFWDCYWWNYDPAVRKRLRAAFDRAVRGEVVRYEETIRVANDRRAVLDFVLKPIFDGGQLLFVVPSAEDITSRKQAEAALAASETRYRSTFENAAVGVAHVALDGAWLRVNDKLCSIVGYSREDLRGKTFQDITHPDDLDAELDLVRQVLSGELNTYLLDKRYIRKAGSVVWTGITVSLQRPQNGEPKYFIAVIVDISEQKDAEAQRDLLVRELAHRAKNQLGVIQGIASQSARHAVSLDAFRRDFAARIQALAASTDLLINQGWESISLRDLIGRQLEPFEANHDRLLYDGPELLLNPDAAQALGLALHELATNCIKYGAWSLPTGEVMISWAVERDGAEPVQMRIDWTERGGPAVSPPTRKGFGRVIIEQLVAQKLAGRIEMSFAPQGFSWTLAAPASQLVGGRTSS